MGCKLFENVTPISKFVLTWLLQVDGVTRYVDWAVSKGFGIMDINVPRHSEVRSGLMPP